jgi:hypothetical protein
MAFWCRSGVRHLARGVVRFRGRGWPSATIAGDALWVWRRAIGLINERAESIGDPELIDESRRLRGLEKRSPWSRRNGGGDWVGSLSRTGVNAVGGHAIDN